MHALWRVDRRTNAVMYICGDQDGANRIKRAGEQTGLTDRLRIELLETIKQQALEACEQGRAKRAAPNNGSGRESVDAGPSEDRPALN